MDALERERESSLDKSFREMMSSFREKAGNSSFTPKQRHFRSGFGANRRPIAQSGGNNTAQRGGIVGEPWNWEKVEAGVQKRSQTMTLSQVVTKAPRFSLKSVC
jgi:hypothetical protein